MVVINRSQPPSLSFPTATSVGSIDTADGPITVSLQNVGNTTLNFPAPPSGNDPSIGADFSLISNGQDDCPITTASSSSPGTLAAGASCVYSVTFAPIGGGEPQRESLVLTDNNLNGYLPFSCGYADHRPERYRLGAQLHAGCQHCRQREWHSVGHELFDGIVSFRNCGDLHGVAGRRLTI